MRTIRFYETASGNCPVKDFLDSLGGKQARKVTWVLQLVKDLPRPPIQYFKKLVGTELWEVRAESGGNAFRLLGFLDGEQLVILTSGFAKKTQKTPGREIDTALARRKDYFNRKKG
jgi:phage-related protein